ncbi:TPA: potassium transporter KtrB [Candidatus Gastranaerophilales bacterium HUM_20]|nr:trk-type K+ transport system membrane component [Clostridium sp. CAG:729]DAB19911.1 MAG TPA: potassium transporter KtrB [Candidatus Gastranaerophilales bacterium HUM_20]
MYKLINSLECKLSKFAPYQVIIFGFVTYILTGLLFISLPCAQKIHVSFVDNLFNIVSALSTTGLTTGNISQLYTPFGKLVLLTLIQLGAIGYMTITSFFILSSGNNLSSYRTKILSAEFTLPENFNIKEFIRNIIIYTFVIELIGTIFLSIEFHKLGITNPVWAGVFHAISAFSTAGFSIFSTGLEAFKNDISINIIIAFLCYSGAIGFIIPMDIYRKIIDKNHKITFTTKVILFITALVGILGTVLYLFNSDSNVLTAFFQVMSASTTAGFNTVNIGKLSTTSLAVLIAAMVIGASPSGTGGGIKSTSISVLLGIVGSVMRGQFKQITFLNKAIPLNRVFTAVASTTTYMFTLIIIVYLLTLTEHFSFMELCFEAASALGTVGLSMGITADLTNLGKIILSLAMFLGRVGPLSIGIAFFKSNSNIVACKSDLAT